MNQVSFSLAPLGPYDLNLVSLVQRRSQVNQIDRRGEDWYARLLIVEGEPVLAHVEQTGSPDQRQLHITLYGDFTSEEAGEIKNGALPQLARLLGFDVDLSDFFVISQRDQKLAPLAQTLKGLKPQRYPALFEAILNCICCQQISLTAGLAILSRLAGAYGPSMEFEGEKYVGPPGPEIIAQLTVDDLRELGLSRRKAESLIGLARAIMDGDLVEAELENSSYAAAMEKLGSFRGIGRWSSHYLMLRGLGRLDVFPIDDVGASRSLARWLGHEDARIPAWRVDEIVSSWDPYRGMLYFYLVAWKRLEAAGQWPAASSA